MIKKLLIATHNSGKAREIAVLLEDYVEEVVTAADLNLPDPEETEATFEGNALLKARAGALASGLPTLADDSGLAVNALDGAPGIYSARWAEQGIDNASAKGGRDFDMAMARVWDELAPHEDKSAAFVCALALVEPDDDALREQVYEGRVDGDITWPKRGDKGFGYDPVFVPKGCDITFAEMEPDQKHAISHRARAFAKLKESLQNLTH